MEPDRHLDEDEIERYSRRQIAELDLNRVEDHLLLCDSCMQRVTASDQFVHSMHQAALQMVSPPRRIPRFVFALAAGAVLLVAGLQMVGKRPAPFAVNLEAVRGSAMGGKAPASTPILLRLDVTGVPASASYRVQMVNRTGQPVWTGKFPGGIVSPQSRGMYFVRLYTPAGELLREYGLEIE